LSLKRCNGSIGDLQGNNKMTNNQRIHNLLGLCWHEAELQACHQAPNTGATLCNEQHWYCVKCGDQVSGDGGGCYITRANYFRDDLPHSTVVAVIQKAVEIHGYQKVNTVLEAIARRMGMQDGLTVTVAMTAAPVVMTAICSLIEQENEKEK
jgi:hypothetical protein